MAIKVLSPLVANRIAAGEVVEKPASVVKELVENSIDSGASKIKVEIEGGGIKKIVVSDNGCGIEKEDLPLAFLPHATSKINSVDDLDAISTLGFRGEALASIAAVCRVSLSTKTKTSETGFKIDASGGEISKISEVARLDGTTLVVEDLFFNTPVRAKFLKKPKSEETEITHIFEKFMMSHPEIDFTYVVDGKEIYNHTSGTLDEVVYLLYGREVHDNLLKLSLEEDGIKVGGFVVSPKISRPNRTYQSLFVNDRYVENYMISACVQGAFESVLMKGRYPIYIIKLDIPFDRVDVNIHPNKREVKFDNTSKVFGVVRRAVEKALVGANLIAEFEYRSEDVKEWQKYDIQNEEHPARTGFNSFQKTDVEKYSEGEGASYKVSVDDNSLEKPLTTAKDYKDKGIDIINQLSNYKPENKKNRPGGFIYFDQSGDSFLREVEISVEKEKAQKKEIEKAEEENFLKAQPKEINILGVAFKTYIFAEFDDCIYVVDQHAMHERQLYDKLKKQIEQNNVSKQDLLFAYDVPLSGKDAEIFENCLENLKKIGFEIEKNGNKFQIKAVPFVLSGINLEKFVEEVLREDVLAERTASAYINEKLCQTACKHAIRAGDSVSKDEILYLIDKIKDGVPLCPHGRPIIVKISRKELEKMFKRVL